MAFYHRSGLFIHTHIPGPSHNLLGLRFHEGEEASSPTVLEIKPVYPQSRRLTPKHVLEEVLAGIEQANSEFGTNYRPSEIRFVPDDSPRSGIYSMLAYRIVASLVRGDKFEELEANSSFEKRVLP